MEGQQAKPTNKLHINEKKRLNNLQHTLKGKHPERIYKYNDQLLDQLKRGFIEQVLDPNTHQGVIHVTTYPIFQSSRKAAQQL